MARRRRFHFPEATYHVMLRGNDGQPIFFSDRDRSRMCLLIQQGVERFGHTIHAYCFMSNHIHLALQVGEVSLSRIIQHLAFRYAQYINRHQDRDGHLFQGRFKSILVDESRYLRQLVRYIHLNPVRAGLVTYPEKYLWSSHRKYLNLDTITWLTTDKVLNCFSKDSKEAVSNYDKYLNNGIVVEEELNFKSGFQNGILGDQEFIDEIERKTLISKGHKLTIPQLASRVCDHYCINELDLRTSNKSPRPVQARALISLLVRDKSEFSLEELAQFLGRDASGLSKLATRLEMRSLTSDTISSSIKELQSWINSTA